jgi:hypothetical protein
MLVFPETLVAAATEAGMELPDNVRDFDKNEYPHFHAFCVTQLGRPDPLGRTLGECQSHRGDPKGRNSETNRSGPRCSWS